MRFFTRNLLWLIFNAIKLRHAVELKTLNAYKVKYQYLSGNYKTRPELWNIKAVIKMICNDVLL